MYISYIYVFLKRNLKKLLKCKYIICNIVDIIEINKLFDLNNFNFFKVNNI
jgi:hypothetical protein